MIKEFLKQNKQKIIKLLLAILTLVAIALVTLAALYFFDVIYFDEKGGINFNAALFNSFKNTWYGCIVFVVLQCVITTLLCVIPGTSMAFIMLATVIYDEPWQAFLLSFAGVIISSGYMYLIGRLGGYKICEKLVGKEDTAEATRLLRSKGQIYFPLMMLFPLFPDDALVMVAGTSKMSLKWFIPSIVIGRGVGISTIVFGFSLVPFETFRGIYDWLVFITVCAFWIILIFYLAHKLNVLLEKKTAAASADVVAAKKEVAEENAGNGAEADSANNNAAEVPTADNTAEDKE